LSVDNNSYWRLRYVITSQAKQESHHESAVIAQGGQKPPSGLPDRQASGADLCDLQIQPSLQGQARGRQEQKQRLKIGRRIGEAGADETHLASPLMNESNVLGAFLTRASDPETSALG
jgi:hypothetical protein